MGMRLVVLSHRRRRSCQRAGVIVARGVLRAGAPGEDLVAQTARGLRGVGRRRPHVGRRRDGSPSLVAEKASPLTQFDPKMSGASGFPGYTLRP